MNYRDYFEKVTDSKVLIHTEKGSNETKTK